VVKLMLETDHDDRGQVRRRLMLHSLTPIGGGDRAEVSIHDLSATGMLIETSTPVSVGEPIEVELPHGCSSEALVVWARGHLLGCVFAEPIPRPAMSAALLTSLNDLSPAPPDDAPASPPNALNTESDRQSGSETGKLPRTVRALTIIISALLAWAVIISIALVIT
jgi:hypothetical protein